MKKRRPATKRKSRKRIELDAATRARAFKMLCVQSGLPEPVTEWRFAAPRRWRFDWAWPERKVALEVEGGIWTRGRHTTGAGYKKDMEKYSTAAALGWLLIRCEPRDLCTEQVLNWVRMALQQREGKAA